MTSVNDAANVYMNTARQLQQGLGAATDGAAAGGAGGVSFGEMLKAGIGSAVESQRHSEQVSMAALRGDASMTELIQALDQAQVALDTVLAVKGKLEQAFETIMRTGI